VLGFVADLAAALAELARVTRHGGRIVIGALNPHSPWGLANRRRLRAGVWCRARFLSRSELRALGTPQGRTSLHGALYAPVLGAIATSCSHSTRQIGSTPKRSRCASM
jgi:SAM-dependent methyltransferase